MIFKLILTLQSLSTTSRVGYYWLEEQRDRFYFFCFCERVFWVHIRIPWRPWFEMTTLDFEETPPCGHPCETTKNCLERWTFSKYGKNWSYRRSLLRLKKTNYFFRCHDFDAFIDANCTTWCNKNVKWCKDATVRLLLVTNFWWEKLLGNFLYSWLGC